MKRYNKANLKVLSNDQLLILKAHLTDDHAEQSMQLKETVCKINDIREELSRRRKSSDRPFVSDHAVLRLLERACGLDVDAVKEQIIKNVPFDHEQLEQLRHTINKVTLVLSKDKKCVSTVLVGKPNEEDQGLPQRHDSCL